MPTKTYEKVTVSMQNGKLTCTPDWVHLNWKDGPADIRWVFDGVPGSATGATVEFLAAVPAKQTVPPGTPGPFLPRGAHRGLGHAQASGGSHLPDIVTTGNTQETGHFCYDVKLLDAGGSVIAHAGPGGDTGSGGGGPH